jgi:hypothetical protein
MTLDDHISNFLRDAQYRIGELSVEMNEIEDQGSYQYRKLNKSRKDIARFMDQLYEGKWLIQTGYNHLQVGDDLTWKEREVIEEIQYLRYYNHMNEIPYVTFTGHYPKIVSIINGGGSGSVGSLPAGKFGQFMGFNGSDQPEAQDFDQWGGHIDGETINNYFSNRL